MPEVSLKTPILENIRFVMPELITVGVVEGMPILEELEWMAWDYDPFNPLLGGFLETQIFT